MSRAVIYKCAYEQRWMMSIIAAAAALFPFVLFNAVGAVPWEAMEPVLELPFAKIAIRVLTGSDVNDLQNLTMVGGFAFVHPVMLALGWACVVVSATRAIAGEIDEGTADLILAMPITRFGYYLSTSIWVLFCAAAVPLACWFGTWMAQLFSGLREPIDVIQYRFLVPHSAVMLCAVAGMSFLVSALSSRRGKSMGVAFGILLTSFLLNWLAAFWPTAEKLNYLGILRYFRPFVILREQSIVWADLCVLLAIAVVTWSVGAFIFCRRDIHTS